MSLSPGSRLGSYEVVAPLGAGGMGEVFRARDTRLGREVAIKTLRRDVAADPDRRERFEREARAASSLNHPAIVTVHEIGEVDGLLYLVMELVDGTSLRDLLKDGPMPPRRAAALAAEAADGLARAHEAGLVHRDIKPENLMVTRDGRLKVLDFGLAKVAALGGASSGSDVATLRPGTTAGAVLGTVGYMSPEQAAGRPVDFRSDLFSLGCVLYEMLAGRRAFTGETAIDTLAAILHKEPPPPPDTVPESLRWIVERCLAKDPNDRYAATRDLALELRHALGSTATGSTRLGRPALPPTRRRGLRPFLSLLAAAAACALAFLAGRLLREPRSVPEYTPLTFRRGNVWSARFSPDGSSALYGAAWDGGPCEIYAVQTTGRPEERPLGLGPADILAVAPDGSTLVSLERRYVQGRESTGTLARSSIGGGAPRELLEGVREADVVPGGGDVLVAREEEGRVRLRPLSGAPLYESPGWISHVRVSPDGRHVAFLEHPARRDDRGSLVVLERAGGRVVRRGPEWPSVAGVAWRPEGREVWYTAAPQLRAAPLSSGPERVVMRFPEYARLLDLDAAGRALLSHDSSHYWIHSRAKGELSERALSWLGQSFPADLSADGLSLLFTEYAVGARYGVFLRRRPEAVPVQLGEGAAMSLSPDGRSALAIVYDKPTRLVVLPTGTGASRDLPRGPLETHHAASFFPDGRTVAILGSEKGSGVRCYVQDLAGGDPRPVSPEGVEVSLAVAASPDGGHVAASLSGKGTFLFPVGGGEPVPVHGLEAGEVAIRFTPEGALLVAAPETRPLRVHRVDPRSGARSKLYELAPADPAGVPALAAFSITPAGDAYVYGFPRILSSLFLVRGLE